MDHKDEDEVHSTRKILVKLKLGFKVEESPAPPPPPPPPEDQEKKHFCKECNKGFASGKALGGHMSSAHVQANKDYSDRKLTSKTRRHLKLGPGAEPEITCNLCGRAFKSEKSLFGHMRCHPERDYRGMEPPSPPVTSSEDDDGDLIDSASPAAAYDLKSWPPGVKRGRGPLGALVRADDALASVHEIVKIVGNGPLKKPKADEVGPKLDEEEDERVKTAVEVLKHMKGEKHVCDLYNKGFFTHQALGGHMSSHNRVNLSIVDNKADHKQSKMLDSDDGNDVRREKVVVGFDLNLMPEEEEEDRSSTDNN